MAEFIYDVKTDEEQVALFMQFAEKYKSDFYTAPLKQFQTADAEDVFAWLVRNYRREVGEIIVRPKFYFEMVQKLGHGLDCDDATIFWCALLRSVGVKPEQILIAEVADERNPDSYCHIFCGVEVGNDVVWLDNLPGSRYGVHAYDSDLMQITRMSDYL